MGVRVILVCSNIKCGSNYGLDFPCKKQIFFLITGFISFWNKVKKYSGSFLIEVL